MGSTAKAIVLNTVLHLLLFGIVWALLYLPTTTEALIQSYREAHQEQFVQQAQLSDALGAIAWWAFWALVIGLLLSSFWIGFVAQRARIERVQRAARYTGSWAVSLLLALVLAGGIYAFWTAGLLTLLAPQNSLYGLTCGLVAVLFGFWLGTGLLVKPAVQAAVPLASFLPSIGAR